MTNTQLWLAICIPSLLVVLSWIQQGARLSRLEARSDKGFEAVDRQFESMERRFDSLRDELHRDMNAFRIEIRAEMTSLRDSIHRDMIALHERVAVVEAKNG